MTVWIAFLRGLNVGGHRLTNVELAATFDGVGATDVHTFLASGNVVFAGLGDDEVAVTAALEQGLRASLGYDVPTFLRSSDEVCAAADTPVFTTAELGRGGKPQVIVVRDHEVTGDAVTALAPPAELLRLVGRQVHWLPAGPMSDSDLDLRALDRLVGTHTIRTHNTVRRLADKYLR